MFNVSTTPSPRAKQKTPASRLHKATGQAVVTVNGRDHYLGRHGTKTSRYAYDRLIAEWLSNGRQLPSLTQAVTVAAVIKAYWTHAKAHYRRADGTETSEVSECMYSLRPLNHLYATLPASDFGPLKFKTVRELLVTGVINKRMLDRPGNSKLGFARTNSGRDNRPLPSDSSQEKIITSNCAVGRATCDCGGRD